MNSAPDYYDSGIKKNLLQKLWHQNRFRVIEKILPKINNKANNKVLDIGCHAGTLAEKISKFLPSAQIYGIDIDRRAISYAQKKRPKVKFQVANAEKLPFADRTFDLITCFEVLEHTRRPEKVLAEINRCLKNKKETVIIVPSESWLFRLIWFFWTKYKGKVWKKAHLHHFDRKKLNKLLRKNGFKIKLQKSSHCGMLLVVKAQKIEKK